LFVFFFLSVAAPWPSKRMPVSGRRMTLMFPNAISAENRTPPSQLSPLPVVNQTFAESAWLLDFVTIAREA
jgi:hypothetical protein